MADGAAGTHPAGTVGAIRVDGIGMFCSEAEVPPPIDGTCIGGNGLITGEGIEGIAAICGSAIDLTSGSETLSEGISGTTPGTDTSSLALRSIAGATALDDCGVKGGPIEGKSIGLDCCDNCA